MPIQAHDERWQLFLQQVQRLDELRAADQSQKVTQITPGYSVRKKGKKAAPVVEKCGLFSFSADGAAR